MMSQEDYGKLEVLPGLKLPLCRAALLLLIYTCKHAESFDGSCAYGAFHLMGSLVNGVFGPSRRAPGTSEVSVFSRGSGLYPVVSDVPVLCMSKTIS